MNLRRTAWRLRHHSGRWRRRRVYPSPRAFVDTCVKGHERTLYSVIGAARHHQLVHFVHRAFRSLDGDDPVTGGLLISILGGQTPGRVKWDVSLANQAKALNAGFDPDGMAVLATP